MKHLFLIFAGLCACVLLAAPDAFASAGGGGGLPYENWLDQVRESVSGPFAFAVSIIGIVVAGAVLIFGGDMSGFFRTLVLIVLIMALLVGANNMMSGVFGRSAVVAYCGHVQTG
jgi:type IV secretion system protein VirB2